MSGEPTTDNGEVSFVIIVEDEVITSPDGPGVVCKDCSSMLSTPEAPAEAKLQRGQWQTSGASAMSRVHDALETQFCRTRSVSLILESSASFAFITSEVEFTGCDKVLA